MTITEPMNADQDIAGYFTPEEWAEALHDDISLNEVRRALSTISGSLSESVIELREEREWQMNRRKRAEKLFHQEAGSDYIDRIVEQTAPRSLLSFVDRRIRIRACHQNQDRRDR